MPLERYLRRAWPMMPAHALRDLLKRRDVKRDGVRLGAEETVRGGDALKVYLPERYAPAPPALIYCDGSLAAAVKPQGLPVDADQDGVGADTLLSRVQARYPSAQLCHRLDAGTSGVVLCARDERSHALLLRAFAEHWMTKKYVALAAGRVEPEQAQLRAWLKKDAGASRVRVFDHPSAGAQEIRTAYRMLETARVKGETLSLMEVTLITGRTHQIRAHMAHIGHPLLGDDKYGDRELNRRLGGGIRLHAAELTLNGPELPEAWQGLRIASPAPKWL